MPWFPDFVSAAELARKKRSADGRADPVAQYLAAVAEQDAGPLEETWPGAVVVYDPHVGEVRGHRQLRQYIRRNQSWLSEQQARTEKVAATTDGPRAVVEMIAHLRRDGSQLTWPIGVVAESPDEASVVLRIYCSQWPFNQQRPVRPPTLPEGTVNPGDVVGRFQSALEAGDAEAVVDLFEPDGYFQEPLGTRPRHHGRPELRSFFQGNFGAGGISLQDCAVTDDGVRCALEYNCVRWGSHQLPPQAGLGVFERGPDGLLAAARFYDDVTVPA